MTDADKITQHFGSNPADIRIRIWINPEIRIQIADHFWLSLDARLGGGYVSSSLPLVH